MAKKLLNGPLEKSLNSGMMLTMAYGILIGWTMFSAGRSEYWNRHIDDLLITLIHVAFYGFAMIGVVFGVFLFGYLGSLKLQMISTVMAFISGIGHLVVAITYYETTIMLTLSRCVAGFGFGLFYPGFVRKISEQSYKVYRGRYSLLAPMSIELSIWLFALFRYSFSRYETITQVAFTSLTMATLSCLGFYNRPYESFSYYIQKCDSARAFQIFRKLRESNTPLEQQMEFAEIEQSIVQQPIYNGQSIIPQNFEILPYVYLGLTKIAHVLVSNAFIFNFLQRTLLKVTDEYIITVLFFFMWLPRVIASLVDYSLIDRFGRQLLMLISTGSCGLIFIVLGIIEVSLLTQNTESNVLVDWMVFILFVALQTAAGFGITVVPDILAGEAIPHKYRKFAMTAIYGLEYMLFGLLTFVTYLTQDGDYGQGYSFIWGSVLLMVGVASKYLMFETKQKSLAEIWGQVMYK